MSTVSLAERLGVVRATGQFSEPVLQDFARHLAEAPEEALFRMNPLAYAEARGLPVRAAVDLFLYATHAGLLGFNWGVLCPACGAFLNTMPALRNLGSTRTCTLCELEVRPTDDNVEVAFTVAPSIRRIRFHDLDSLELRRDGLNVFFSANRQVPEALAATLAQFGESVLYAERLPTGMSSATLEVSEGWHGVFAPGHHAWGHFEVTGAATSSEQTLELVEGRFVPLNFELRPGKVTLHFASRLPPGAACGVVRRLLPPRKQMNPEKFRMKMLPYLTGKMLVTSQVFRELFRVESIPSDAGLEFKDLTMLFTDLKGSTSMYERIGDFRAYGLVREHFDLLKEIIAERGGSMVKTIGDAVMASFAEPVSALRAAAEMNRSIAALGKQGEQLQLKIGLHSGPCIAVELNERLDYFGQTVNIASRVQGEAAANEIVCTEPVFAASGVAGIIEAAALSVKRDQATLKGVDGQVTVYRMSTPAVL